MRVQVRWLQSIFNFFGLQIEKIPTKVCPFCDGPLPVEPAKVIVNDGSEIEICDTCEKILELSNKAVQKGRAPVEDEEDGDEPL
jgi:hypothetical protein